MADIIINDQLGQDSIKGGIFYGSNLTPSGIFQNIPNKTEVSNETYLTTPSLTLTLEKIKDSLKKNAKDVQGTSDDVLSDQAINTYLSTYVQLLIDYEDIRNLVFFGSAYNEMVYNIDYHIQNYPYRSFIAKLNEILDVEVFVNNQTKVNFRTEDILFGGGLNYDDSRKTIWIGLDSDNLNYNPEVGYDLMDKNNRRYPILSFDQAEIKEIIDVTPKLVDFFQIEISEAKLLQADDSINFLINEDIVGTGIVTEYAPIDVSILPAKYTYGTTALGSAGNILFDINRNDPAYTWADNDLRIVNKWVEIAGKRWKIISNTGSKLFLEDGANIPVNEFYVIEDYHGIETTDGKTSFHIRYTPKLLFSSSATSGGTGTNIISDLNSSFDTNLWVDKWINITSGPGKGFLSKIISNTTHNLTFEDVLNVVVTKETKYIILDFPNSSSNQSCQLPPTIMSFIVEGVFSTSNLINYNRTETDIFKGILISPKAIKLVNYNSQLTGIQKALINPLNPTPWPREAVTQNLITSGIDFENWIENPYNMIKEWNLTDVEFYENEDAKYNLKGAITLDELNSNQLLRRAIPQEIVNELNDTDSRYFTRFILLAGKMFDVIKVYIDFIKYVHTLNYTQYNQLSPDYYKQYAEHYGFTLFDEDTIELAKTIIYGEQNNTIIPSFISEENPQTVKDIINEKQKLLLINLLHLYQKKGTIDCLYFLTSLLGAPEGLALIEEFVYDSSTGNRIVDNEKIYTPDIELVIDKEIVSNPINYPYVYKYKLSNENITNLREISFGLDPLAAIITDMLKYGKQLYPFGYFGERTFGNLQDFTDKFYYFLPLSFPDKYCGISVDYQIPKGGLGKGVMINQGELGYNMCGLFKIGNMEFETPIISVAIETVPAPYKYFILKTELLIDYNPDLLTPRTLKVTGMSEMIYSGTYKITNVTFDEFNTFIKIEIPITAVVSSDPGDYLGKGSIREEAFNEEVSKVVPIMIGKKYNYYITPIFLTSGEIPTPEKENLINYPVKTAVNSITFFGTVAPAKVGQMLTIYIVDSLGGRTAIGSTPWQTSLKDTVESLADSINSTSSDPDFSADWQNIPHSHSAYSLSIILNQGSVVLNQPCIVEIKTEGFNEITNVYISDPSLSTESNKFEADEYIITRLEDQDLIIRLRLKSENSLSYISRLAIFENYFEDDGLIHKLKLIFRQEGAEVYRDNNYIGLARWRELIEGGTYKARNYPKADIKGLNIVPLPVELFAWPDVNPLNNNKWEWWDLFVGYPAGVNVNISRISVFENLAINQLDLLEGIVSTESFTNEKFLFDFKDQVTDSEGLYIENTIKIPCQYQIGNPIALENNPDLTDAIENYILNNISRINLTSKTLPPGRVKFSTLAADFFKHNGEQITKEEDLFAYNGHSHTLHKDYKYDNLNEGLENYYSFADITLTYAKLLPFIETIEAKFRKLIVQFLPIVINLSTFGRILKNYYEKIHYEKIEVNEQGTRNCGIISAGIQFISGSVPPTGNPFYIYIKYIRDDIKIINVSDRKITYLKPHKLSNGDLIEIANIVGINGINGENKTVTVIDDYTIQIASDTWTGEWNKDSGQTILLEEDLNPTTPGSNYYFDSTGLATASLVASTIEAKFFEEINVSQISDTIYLTPDADWWSLSHNGREITEATLTIVEGDGNKINIFNNFEDIVCSQQTGTNYLIVTYEDKINVRPDNDLYIYKQKEPDAPIIYINYQGEGAEDNLIYIQ